MLIGVAASPGIGIGKAVVIKQEEVAVEKHTVHYLDAEKQRYMDAARQFVAEIQSAYDIAIHNISTSEAAILSAQITIVEDQELTREVFRAIERQKVNVEYAFNSVCNYYIAIFSNLKDELMRARAADFHDIKNRMLSILTGTAYCDLSALPAESVIVADDIPPSQAVLIHPGHVQGIVTQDGTKFAHISIIARALQIPAVVAVKNLMEAVSGGEVIIVDGDAGRAQINPSEADFLDYRAKLVAARQKRAHLESYRDKPTLTSDGRRITLSANLAVPQELGAIRNSNADGIGLFRTEFVFMERKKPPTESEQYETYKNVVLAMENRPVIIRTLDVGGDKSVPYLHMLKESNPFLGYRAVRFCLGSPNIFKAQLSAILRAAIFGDVRIMIPMISTITELREVKGLIAEVSRELAGSGVMREQPVPIGIMIETPAAVMCAEELARESDFFSIGTNDLTQYILAVDRSNDHVSALYDSRHPAVLRMIKLVADAAHKADIPVSICGEAASDPLSIPFFIGVGITRLSVSSSALLPVRSLISGVSCEYWERQVPEILSLSTPEEVIDFIGSRLDSIPK